MKTLLKAVLLSMVAGFPVVLCAADVPTVVDGSGYANKDDCISSVTNDCIENVCMNSSDTDCQDKCTAAAPAKCRDN
jgi:CO dehydrogenase/acetyl-CoA synthase delta subunit